MSQGGGREEAEVGRGERERDFGHVEEADGLFARTDLGGNPPHVEYALTELGRSLLVPLRAVRQWAETHVPDILAARERAGVGEASG